MIQGVIFDMDGLMFDTERLSMDAWREESKKMGYIFTPEVGKAVRGRNDADIREIMKEFYGPELDYTALRDGVRGRMDAQMLEEGVPVKPGLYELLGWLKEQGIPRALASSSRLKTVEMRCRIAGIWEDFDRVVCGDMVEHSKPQPDIFLRAAREIGVDPAHSIVLEDSFNGVRAGAAGGFITVMVPDLDEPTPEIEALYSAKAKSLTEVLERLKQGEWN